MSLQQEIAKAEQNLQVCRNEMFYAVDPAQIRQATAIVQAQNDYVESLRQMQYADMERDIVPRNKKLLLVMR